METPAGTGLSPPTVHGDQSGLLRDILASHRTAGTASGKAGAFDRCDGVARMRASGQPPVPGSCALRAGRE
jgi:hypothetical protein